MYVSACASLKNKVQPVKVNSKTFAEVSRLYIKKLGDEMLSSF